MHMAIGSTLTMYENRLRPFFTGREPLSHLGGNVTDSRGRDTAGTGSGLRVVRGPSLADDLDVIPLYVETNPERGAAELAAELAAEALTGFKPASVPTAAGAVGDAQPVIRFGAGVPAYPSEDAGPRRSAVISEGRRASFATYFNAFPASYWRRWTTVNSVTLRVRLAGESTLVLYRSTARGHSHPVETIGVRTDQPVTIERTPPPHPVHRRRLVLVRRRGRPARDHPDRGGMGRARRRGPGARTAQHRHHHLQPPR
jgi:hypothetical protein